MKKVGGIFLAISLFFVASNASAVQQTICFSKAKDDIKVRVYGERNPKLKTMALCDLPSGLTEGSIGDSAILCGGQCKGKTLKKMNKQRWRLIHVIEGLEGAFGMVLQKN